VLLKGLSLSGPGTERSFQKGSGTGSAPGIELKKYAAFRLITPILPTMSTLASGEYMLSNIQWRKREQAAALRPLRGFSTGKLYVGRRTARVEARFTDQNLSNRFSDLEEDGVPVTLQVTLLGETEVYLLPGRTPTLERAGACYVLRVKGKTKEVSAVHPAA
jgi:hypothetical protein